jgi:hypothetical protein
MRKRSASDGRDKTVGQAGRRAYQRFGDEGGGAGKQVAASRVREEEAWVQFIGGFPLRDVIWAVLGCGGLSPPPSIVSVVSLPVSTGLFLSSYLLVVNLTQL